MENKTLKLVLEIVGGIAVLWILIKVFALVAAFVLGALAITGGVLVGLITLVIRFLVPIAIVGGLAYLVIKKCN